MALDTAAKRASALGYEFAPSLFIIPDGTIDQGDRQTIVDLYSGILAILPQKWVTQAPDATSYSTQAPDTTSYTTQTPDGTLWTTQPEDS